MTWCRRLIGWWRQDDLIDTLIKPPKVLHADFNPQLRASTQRRREAAERIRGRANQVQSGTGLYDILRQGRK